MLTCSAGVRDGCSSIGQSEVGGELATPKTATFLPTVSNGFMATNTDVIQSEVVGELATPKTAKLCRAVSDGFSSTSTVDLLQGSDVCDGLADRALLRRFGALGIPEDARAMRISEYSTVAERGILRVDGHPYPPCVNLVDRALLRNIRGPCFRKWVSVQSAGSFC